MPESAAATGGSALEKARAEEATANSALAVAVGESRSAVLQAEESALMWLLNSSSEEEVIAKIKARSLLIRNKRHLEEEEAEAAYNKPIFKKKAMRPTNYVEKDTAEAIGTAVGAGAVSWTK
jgi:hypothetical protein